MTQKICAKYPGLTWSQQVDLFWIPLQSKQITTKFCAVLEMEIHSFGRPDKLIFINIQHYCEFKHKPYITLLCSFKSSFNARHLTKQPYNKLTSILSEITLPRWTNFTPFTRSQWLPLFLNAPLIVWNSIMLIRAKVGNVQARCFSSPLLHLCAFENNYS